MKLLKKTLLLSLLLSCFALSGCVKHLNVQVYAIGPDNYSGSEATDEAYSAACSIMVNEGLFIMNYGIDTDILTEDDVLKDYEKMVARVRALSLAVRLSELGFNSGSFGFDYVILRDGETKPLRSTKIHVIY